MRMAHEQPIPRRFRGVNQPPTVRLVPNLREIRRMGLAGSPPPGTPQPTDCTFPSEVRVRAIVGLRRGAQIHAGSGADFPIRTTIPDSAEQPWNVLVRNTRCVGTDAWVDVDRGAIDPAGGETGWVLWWQAAFNPSSTGQPPACVDSTAPTVPLRTVTGSPKRTVGGAHRSRSWPTPLTRVAPGSIASRPALMEVRGWAPQARRQYASTNKVDTRSAHGAFHRAGNASRC
jgi:hypothetical protein